MNRYIYGRRLLDERLTYRRWVDPRIGSLRLPDILTYLRERGWVEVTPDRPHTLVFREPTIQEEGFAFYQFVPDSEEYLDYRQSLFELLTGIAEYEDRQASAVIDDILGLAARRNQSNGSAAPAADTTATR